MHHKKETQPTSHAFVSLFSSKALLLALAEASVSRPDETNSSMVEEESENRKMGKELAAGEVGEGQDVVVEERSDREISFKMDSQVLDCNICFKPLKPPIFQVINRHTPLLALAHT